MFKNKFLLIIFVLCASVSVSFAQEALVLLSKGGVQIMKKGGSNWENCKKGTPIFLGDKLKTNDKGISKILFIDDQSVLKIRSNSEIEFLGDKTNGKVAKDVFMSAGEILVKVIKGKNTDFKVSTPTSVASVKGTEFWAIHSDGTTTVIGLSGIVELFNKISKETTSVTANLTGTSSLTGAVGTKTTKTDDVPAFEGDSSSTGGIKILRLKFIDQEGQEKTLVIEYREK